jgi:hypothetical protein
MPRMNFATAPFTLLGVALGLGGCMFDIMHVRQTPVHFTASENAAGGFRLVEPVRISIGTGFATRLNGGTVWRETGRVDAGTVFTTNDQIVTVEASNIHEARIVVAGGALVGFFLPVEKTFVSVVPSLPLKSVPIASSTNPP